VSLAITAAGNAASYQQQSFAPGELMLIYGTALDAMTSGEVASTVPLPQYMAGLEAYMCPVSCNTGAFYPVPIYYVYPGEAVLQIPYEIPAGTVDLSLGNPYQSIDYIFTVTNTAPGIFMLFDGTYRVSNGVSPNGTPGQGFTLYFTGQGALTPSVPDGYSPSANGNTTIPRPRAAVTVSVAGIQASTTDGNWFVGVPGWSVGVTQVNFTIPQGVPAGNQKVIVTVGGVQSAPAYITIQ
jgi:uncharacterized protein (TIGR03437 family)